MINWIRYLPACYSYKALPTARHAQDITPKIHLGKIKVKVLGLYIIFFHHVRRRSYCHFPSQVMHQRKYERHDKADAHCDDFWPNAKKERTGIARRKRWLLLAGERIFWQFPKKKNRNSNYIKKKSSKGFPLFPAPVPFRFFDILRFPQHPVSSP